MALTFDSLISHNKRTSLFLVLGLTIFTAAFCGFIGGAFAGGPFIRQGFFIGAGISMIGAMGSFYFGPSVITAITGAKPIEKADDPELFNVVEEMAIAAGLPMPKVYLIPETAPNAFATGRDPNHSLVAITVGLREKLTRDELQGVIAHEMAHIKNYDIRLMMLVGVFAGLIVLFADFYTRSLRYTSMEQGRSNDKDGKGNSGSGFGYMALILVALLVSIIAPLIARILKLAVSRQREYLADATGVQFCRNPLALARALKKISGDPTPLRAATRATEHMFIVSPGNAMQLSGGEMDSMWSTHPPVSKRIERLVQLAGNSGIDMEEFSTPP